MQALGRRADFESQDDAIVRVSIHALRKRLNQFYFNEGAEHRIRMMLPAGQYVPQFLRREEAWRAAAGERSGVPAAVPAPGPLVVGRGAQRPVTSVPPHIQPAAPPVAPLPPGTVRLLAGDRPAPLLDSAGQAWFPDHAPVRPPRPARLRRPPPTQQQPRTVG